jgi:predicted nucleic acid-binding protein
MLRHLAEGKYATVELNQRVVDESLRLTFNQSLRAYDAVQLASALVASSGLELSRFAFVIADEKLAAVSRASGPQTKNPSER